jgi:plasmid stabilization system protein ParE
MNVIWTSKASSKFEEVLEYLLKNWTNKDAQRLIQQTNSTIKKIQKNPSIFKLSAIYNYLRKAKVTKHNSIIYQIDETEIIIIDYLDNRSNHMY